MARLATAVNAATEDIGARRLHTIIERVIEEISFDAPDRKGERIVIDAAFVGERIGEVAADEDLSSYILLSRRTGAGCRLTRFPPRSTARESLNPVLDTQIKISVLSSRYSCHDGHSRRSELGGRRSASQYVGSHDCRLDGLGLRHDRHRECVVSG